MEPTLLIRSQINDQQWDLFIERSRQRVVYAYSWYLDIVCKDWNALVWPSADNFRVVMPLPVKRKMGFRVVQQPLFCQFLGLFSEQELTAIEAEAFLKSLCSHFSYISTYSFHPQNYNILDPLIFQFKQLEFTTNHTFWLKLNAGHETVQAGYSSHRKVNLGRAEQFGWSEIASADINPIIDLFRNHHAVKIEGGVRVKAYHILKILFEKLTEKQCAQLWYARSNGVIHAGCLFVKEGETAIYLFNAADQTGRRGHARTYLLDNYFKRQSGTIRHFDFESPEVKSIAHFYEHFGAEKMPFVCMRRNNLPFLVNQIQQLRKWLLATAR